MGASTVFPKGRGRAQYWATKSIPIQRGGWVNRLHKPDARPSQSRQSPLDLTATLGRLTGPPNSRFLLRVSSPIAEDCAEACRADAATSGPDNRNSAPDSTTSAAISTQVNTVSSVSSTWDTSPMTTPNPAGTPTPTSPTPVDNDTGTAASGPNTPHPARPARHGNPPRDSLQVRVAATEDSRSCRQSRPF